MEKEKFSNLGLQAREAPAGVAQSTSEPPISKGANMNSNID
jgi:hypothetical protein